MSVPDSSDHPVPATERKARLLSFKLPVHVHNVPMVLVAAFVAVYLLQWAKPFLVPLLLGILISYALSSSPFLSDMKVLAGSWLIEPSAATARQKKRLFGASRKLHRENVRRRPDATALGIDMLQRVGLLKSPPSATRPHAVARTHLKNPSP